MDETLQKYKTSLVLEVPGVPNLMKAFRVLSPGASTADISFHAQLTTYQEMHEGDVIPLDNVILNEGKGYNSTSGKFTSPANGTFFFIATTSSYMDDKYAQMDLVVDDTPVAYARVKYGAYYDMGTCHAVVKLGQGQRAWLRSSGDSFFAPQLTTFSGFLVAAS